MGPFGDGFSETLSTLDFTGFAGGFWDSENNADHFGAREYAKSQGRWLTPDPAGLAAVNPSNPQTWNRYAYALDSPASLKDPSGLVTPICEDAGDNPNGGGCNAGGGGDDDNIWNNGNVSGTLCDVQYSFDDCGGMGGLMDGSFGDAQGFVSQECAGMSARACQGMLQYEAANGLLPPMPGDDPCIFTQTDSNGKYNGTYTVNATMTKQQCGEAGGQWAPPGYNWQVSPNGTLQVDPIPSQSSLWQAMQDPNQNQGFCKGLNYLSVAAFGGGSVMILSTPWTGGASAAPGAVLFGVSYASDKASHYFNCQ